METYNYTETNELILEEPVFYGGFWERFGAALIDGILMTVIDYAIQLLVDGPAYVLITLPLNWLYFALMESGEGQATLGKKALGLKVTAIDGGRISFGQATGRYFGKIISTMILFIGYLLMIWDDKKQTLHDKMAGTLVVRTQP